MKSSQLADNRAESSPSTGNSVCVCEVLGGEKAGPSRTCRSSEWPRSREGARAEV